VLVTVLHILCASVLSTHTHIHVHKCTMSLCHYYLQLYIFCFAFVWSLFHFPSLFSFQFFLTLFLLFPHSFSGAFRTLGATEAKLSDNLKRIFLELLEEKSACGDFDTQSLSLAVFSIAHIGKLRSRAFLHSLSTLSSSNNFTSLHLIYPSASFSSSLPPSPRFYMGALLVRPVPSVSQVLCGGLRTHLLFQRVLLVHHGTSENGKTEK
jgi:hypothetical protein